MDSENIIIGATGVGAHAGEWTQFMTLAMKQNIRAEDIADTIFADPTYAEILLTISADKNVVPYLRETVARSALRKCK